MRRETITQTQIVELTRTVVHGFYERQVAHLIHHLHDDFVWIGAFDFQFATSKQQFLDIVQSELASTEFVMQDERYDLIARDKDSFILCCKFKLTDANTPAPSIQAHTRLTVVWKYCDGVPLLIHVHGSNAQDVPLNIPAAPPVEELPSVDFLNYIKKSTTQSAEHKVMLRTVSGEHYVFSEDKILYLQTEGQHTRLYTTDSSILISGILRTHQTKLSNRFYRVHKAYLINLDYLVSLHRYQLTLMDDTILPVSKERYLPLKKMFINPPEC